MKKETIKVPDSTDVNSRSYRLYQNFHMGNRNDYYSSLGVRVIWVEDYDEIPKVLREISGI